MRRQAPDDIFPGRALPRHRNVRGGGDLLLRLRRQPVRKDAAARGLNLADGLGFFPDGGGERFLRLPFCALTPEQIDEGVARLATSVKAVS